MSYEESFRIDSRDSDEVKRIVQQHSSKNPDVYYNVINLFGPVVFMRKRFHALTPSDSVFGGYWLNGKFKPFTEKQWIADSNATPTLR